MIGIKFCSIVCDNCFFKDAATTEIYMCGHTLSLRDALPVFLDVSRRDGNDRVLVEPESRQIVGDLLLHLAEARLGMADQVHLVHHDGDLPQAQRSEEHTSKLQSLMRTSYADFCLKKIKQRQSAK